MAEIARYLNKKPLEVEDVLARSAEGIEGILVWINKANRILYEVVIPRLFKELYSIAVLEGEPRDRAQAPRQGSPRWR